MEFTAKIILVICLMILLIILYLSDIDEQFSNLPNNNYFQNISDIKKSKIIKKSTDNKQDYGELEVKIISSNPIYEKLNNNK